MVQDIDFIFELCKSLLSSLFSLFRKKVDKTVPLCQQKAKKRRRSIKQKEKFISESNNIQIQNNEFIASQLNLKSIDRICKQDEQNPQNLGELPIRTPILEDITQSIPIILEEKELNFFKLKMYSRIFKQFLLKLEIVIQIQMLNLITTILKLMTKLTIFSQILHLGHTFKVLPQGNFLKDQNMFLRFNNCIENTQ
ncbi:hypothetical protein ABPG72_008876 [Tetrahymena utriculariae]